MNAKRFSTAEEVVAALLVLSEVAVKAIADLSLGIPVIGEIGFAGAELYTVAIYAVFILWFVFKLGGFGTVGMYLTVGGLADAIGIPVGLAFAVGAGMYLTNHPKVKAVAGVVGGFEGGAEAGAAEAGEAAEGVTEVEEAATAAEGTAQGAEAAQGAEGVEAGTETGKAGAGTSAEEAGAQEAGAETNESEKTEGERKAEEELTPEAEKNPMDIEQKNLFQETPESEFEGKESGTEAGDENGSAQDKPLNKEQKFGQKVQDITSGRGQNLKDYQADEDKEDFGDEESEKAA